MYESKEIYGKSWADGAEEAVVPQGWISVRNLAGIFDYACNTVRELLKRKGLESQMVQRVSVDGRKLIGRLMVFRKEESLKVMTAWDERREARAARGAAREERKAERLAELRRKEAEHRALVAEGRKKVRERRKRMFQERKAELAREKEEKRLLRAKDVERVLARRRASRERLRARAVRVK